MVGGSREKLTGRCALSTGTGAGRRQEAGSGGRCSSAGKVQRQVVQPCAGRCAVEREYRQAGRALPEGREGFVTQQESSSFSRKVTDRHIGSSRCFPFFRDKAVCSRKRLVKVQAKVQKRHVAMLWGMQSRWRNKGLSFFPMFSW